MKIWNGKVKVPGNVSLFTDYLHSCGFTSTTGALTVMLLKSARNIHSDWIPITGNDSGCLEWKLYVLLKVSVVTICYLQH